MRARGEAVEGCFCRCQEWSPAQLVPVTVWEGPCLVVGAGGLAEKVRAALPGSSASPCESAAQVAAAMEKSSAKGAIFVQEGDREVPGECLERFLYFLQGAARAPPPACPGLASAIAAPEHRTMYDGPAHSRSVDPHGRSAWLRKLLAAPRLHSPQAAGRPRQPGIDTPRVDAARHCVHLRLGMRSGRGHTSERERERTIGRAMATLVARPAVLPDPSCRCAVGVGAAEGGDARHRGRARRDAVEVRRRLRLAGPPSATRRPSATAVSYALGATASRAEWWRHGAGSRGRVKEGGQEEEVADGAETSSVRAHAPEHHPS